MQFVPAAGRILFALPFLMFGMGHLTDPGSMAGMVPGFLPASSAIVVLTGIVIILGGLSIMVGFHTKKGAWLLFLFLVPTAIFVWGSGMVSGDQVAFSMFFKDLGLAGAALFFSYSGAGPMSLDARADSA